MSLIIKDVKDESSFKKISILYKKSFPKKELIPVNRFHQYAFNDNICFKSFYDNEKFIGFIKGFICDFTLYISWFAITNSRYEEYIVKTINKTYKKYNVIFVLRDKNKIQTYEKLGFEEAKVHPSLAAQGYCFMCSKKEEWDDQEIVNYIKRFDWPLMFKGKDFAYCYYSNVSNLNIDKNLIKLPKYRYDKAIKFKFDKDRKLSIGVYLLLKKVLKKHHINIDEFEWLEEENGRPYLKDCPYNFSLSHSGDYVAVALSKHPIGVDIQEMNEVDENVVKYICNEKDFEYYNSSKNKKEAFYKIWTFKEAYLKKLGVGITKKMSEVYINYLFNFNGSFFYRFSAINNYILAVSSDIYQIKNFIEVKL